ncbi:MAG: radical SAM protein [Ignisphaera sp.]
MAIECMLRLQGYETCGCVVETYTGFDRPCRAGLRFTSGEIYRLIYDVVLSRPEDYLSIYQSGCNHNCLKCHSWYFAQRINGYWASPRDILEEVLRYRGIVTVWEPRERATMWHASDLCAHCGLCVAGGRRGLFCPGRLKSEQILLSRQGWGPARNIVSFTGGDLYCQPSFYTKTFGLVKREAPDMWIHIETNGYGLTPKNLELLYEAGLDSVWLDMKAFDGDRYRALCGTSNRWILDLPVLLKDMGMLFEVVLLYIPTLVEVDQIEKFAEHLSRIDRSIPVMLLAFFPEYRLSHLRTPTTEEMLIAYSILRSKLHNVKVGNVTVFCKTIECIRGLIDTVGRDAVSL